MKNQQNIYPNAFGADETKNNQTQSPPPQNQNGANNMGGLGMNNPMMQMLMPLLNKGGTPDVTSLLSTLSPNSNMSPLISMLAKQQPQQKKESSIEHSVFPHAISVDEFNKKKKD